MESLKWARLECCWSWWRLRTYWWHLKRAAGHSSIFTFCELMAVANVNIDMGKTLCPRRPCEELFDLLCKTDLLGRHVCGPSEMAGLLIATSCVGGSIQPATNVCKLQASGIRSQILKRVIIRLIMFVGLLKKLFITFFQWFFSYFMTDHELLHKVHCTDFLKYEPNFSFFPEIMSEPFHPPSQRSRRGWMSDADGAAV